MRWLRWWWCPRCWRVKHRTKMMWMSTEWFPWCRSCWAEVAWPSFGLHAEEE